MFTCMYYLTYCYDINNEIVYAGMNSLVTMDFICNIMFFE